jgi:hypothetical protein
MIGYFRVLEPLGRKDIIARSKELWKVTFVWGETGFIDGSKACDLFRLNR